MNIFQVTIPTTWLNAELNPYIVWIIIISMNEKEYQIDWYLFSVVFSEISTVERFEMFIDWEIENGIRAWDSESRRESFEERNVTFMLNEFLRDWTHREVLLRRIGDLVAS